MKSWILAILFVGILACTGGRPTATPTPGIVPASTGERGSLSLVANPTVVGTLDGLPNVTDVFVSGGLAFVSDRQTGVWIVDVSDPTAPVVVRAFGDAEVFASGDLAYVAGFGGLRIWDVSEPSNPVEVGSLDTPNGRVFVSGGLAYVAASGRGLLIVDVSVPSAPVQVGSLDTPAWRVFVSGGLAYVTARDRGLLIVDVSVPSAPVPVGSILDTPNVVDVFVSGGLAYVADDTSGLQILDVSDPANPIWVGSLDIPASEVIVSGQMAYIVGGGALRVVDVSDPTAPLEAGFLETRGETNAVYISGGLAYMADGPGGLRIVDVSDPSALVEVGTLSTLGQAQAVFVSEGLAFVTDFHADRDVRDLHIVDVSNTQVPVEVGSLALDNLQGLTVFGIFVSGGLLFMAGGGELLIVDVSHASNPVEVGVLAIPGLLPAVIPYGGYFPIDLVASGSLVFVSGTFAGDSSEDWFGGLRIVDISDPTAPVEIGALDTSGFFPGGLAVSDGLALMSGNFVGGSGDFVGGLRILDVSDPTAPVEVGALSTPDRVKSSFLFDDQGVSVFVSNDLLFLSDDHIAAVPTLHIVDLSNPSIPVEVGFLDIPGGAIFASEALVFVAYGDLRIVDVGNPTSPLEIGSLNTGHPATGVFVSEGLVYVAAAGSGLLIIDPGIAISPEPRETVVTFPDANLDSAIRHALRSVWVGGVPVAELAGLTTLAASSVTDLTGIEHLVNLTQLNLSGAQYNRVSDLSSLASLTNLSELDLLGNQIRDISPLANLTNLTELVLHNNQISDISPLVENGGLGQGDQIDIRHNDLDLSEGSDDMKNIKQLAERGVRVAYSPQRDRAATPNRLAATAVPAGAAAPAATSVPAATVAPTPTPTTLPTAAATFTPAPTPTATPTPSPMPTASPGPPITGDTFLTVGTLAAARWGNTATLLADGRVLVAGGSDSSSCCNPEPVGLLASSELYDPPASSFVATASLAAARRGHTATLLPDGKVLITGGVVSGQGTVSVAEALVYNPSTGAFSPTGSMGNDRASHRATRLVDGRVLITGGVTVLIDGHVHSYGYFPHAELYDPSTGRFAPTGLMPTALKGHTSTLLADGDVLVIGVSSGYRPRHAALYDPTTGNFTPTGNPLTLRSGHTATLLPSGQVMITGGKWKGITASAELYDPTTGTFSATGSMNIGRTGHTATLLSNGKVLITGGRDNAPGGLPNTPRVFDSAELYDPSTGVFTPTGSMAAARGLHSAILLLDGNVLVVGGLGADGLLASAEVFHP